MAILYDTLSGTGGQQYTKKCNIMSLRTIISYDTHYSSVFAQLKVGIITEKN